MKDLIMFVVGVVLILLCYQPKPSEVGAREILSANQNQIAELRVP